MHHEVEVVRRVADKGLVRLEIDQGERFTRSVRDHFVAIHLEGVGEIGRHGLI